MAEDNAPNVKVTQIVEADNPAKKGLVCAAKIGLAQRESGAMPDAAKYAIGLMHVLETLVPAAPTMQGSAYKSILRIQHRTHA